MLNRVQNNTYGSLEWMCIKLSLAYYWFKTIKEFTGSYSSVPLPAGVCAIFDCSILLSDITRPVVIGLSLVLIAFYLLEKHMVLTTAAMGLISVFWFTVEESNGIYPRTSLLSFVFFAQFLAYVIKQFSPAFQVSRYRVHFPIQAIAASYTLAAISKLQTSGLTWITDGSNISIQVLKSYCSRYFTHGDINDLLHGQQAAQWLLNHTTTIHVFLAFSLVLELFCVVTIFSKLAARIYGLLLFGMHVGIELLMNIFIAPVAVPMLIFMVNPLYIVLSTALSLPLMRRFKPSELTE